MTSRVAVAGSADGAADAVGTPEANGEGRALGAPEP
jgi:hypothetical protein